MLSGRAGDKGCHFRQFRPEPVVQPTEPPVDGDAVRTLQQFLNWFSPVVGLRAARVFDSPQ